MNEKLKKVCWTLAAMLPLAFAIGGTPLTAAKANPGFDKVPTVTCNADGECITYNRCASGCYTESCC